MAICNHVTYFILRHEIRISNERRNAGILFWRIDSGVDFLPEFQSKIKEEMLNFQSQTKLKGMYYPVYVKCSHFIEEKRGIKTPNLSLILKCFRTVLIKCSGCFEA